MKHSLIIAIILCTCILSIQNASVYPEIGELSYEAGLQCKYANNTDEFQRNYLVQFYEETGGINWTIGSKSWNSTESYCLWGGISCNFNCSVTQLMINQNNMSGTLPSVLSKFSNLNVVQLPFNHISGDLNILSKLENITHILINNNKYIGTLPDYISPTVLSINFGYNELVGTLPNNYYKLGSLFSLILNNNNFVGTIPETWKSLTKLVNFALCYNNISGIIPEIFSNNLGTLDLRNNKLEGSLPISMVSQKITQIFLSNNMLIGEIPPQWYYMSNLETLHLQNNYLTGDIAEFTRNKYKLQYVWIWNNSFTDPYPIWRFCYKLSSFRAQYNNFTQPLIPPLEGLVSIDLRNNPIETKEDMFTPTDYAYQIIGNSLCPYLTNSDNKTLIMVDPKYYNMKFCIEI